MTFKQYLAHRMATSGKDPFCPFAKEDKSLGHVLWYALRRMPIPHDLKAYWSNR